MSSTERTFRFEVPGEVTLRLDLASADVALQTHDEQSVEVDLVAPGGGDTSMRNLEAFRVELEPRPGQSDVVVIEQRGKKWSFGRGRQALVRIRCPHGASLDGRAGSSDLLCVGRLGAVDVQVIAGDVGLEQVGRVTLDSRSGDVEIQEASGPAEITATSGDVRLRRTEGRLTAKLVSGDLHADSVVGPLAVVTVSGDVHVGESSGGDVRVQTVSGDVWLGVGAGQQLWLDVSSVSGSTNTDLDLSDPGVLAPAAEVYEVRVKSVSGDVNIARAVSSSPR